jgi:uracil phosphoribosyltransferase
MKHVTVISHPLVQCQLTRLRDARTPPMEFRRLLRELATLMAVEVTRSLRVKPVAVRTPLEKTTGSELERGVVLVPVLRAGLGMVEPLLQLIPDARVGFLGLKRDEATLLPHSYHRSLPKDLAAAEVILIDPMLATGGSAVAALDQLRAAGARRLRLLCLVAAPEGIARVRQDYQTVPIFTAAIDRQLNDVGYILPGLGDAGDRLFGT